MVIKGKEFTVEKMPVSPENTDIDSGFVLISKRGIRYHMIRNNHDKGHLFAVPENILKNADPRIWLREEDLEKELASTNGPAVD